MCTGNRPEDTGTRLVNFGTGQLECLNRCGPGDKCKVPGPAGNSAPVAHPIATHYGLCALPAQNKCYILHRMNFCSNVFPEM